MAKIAIVASLRRHQGVTVVREVVQWLEQQAVEVRLQQGVAEHLQRGDLASPDELLMEGASLALSLGGDGTMLATARLAAPRGIPILGCNLGGFGFLTEVTESELMAALPQVLARDYEVRDRMMVEGELVRQQQPMQSLLGLNDVVITKGALSRVLRLEIAVGGEELGVFLADGVIVATPTGSTAYSLSAGGPVVDPRVEALIVTTMSAHTLSARPMIASAEDEVWVNANPLEAGQEVMVTVDGQPGFRLEPGDLVRVRKARVAAHTVHLAGPSFVVKVRAKLGWAGGS